MVTLSPMTVATVCHVGDPLQITCTASVEFIKWSVLQANKEIFSPVHINSRDSSVQMSQIVVEPATFTFVRTSVRGTSPLISTLSIDSLNTETTVKCTDVGNPLTSASTIIQIINSSNSKLIIIVRCKYQL